MRQFAVARDGRMTLGFVHRGYVRGRGWQYTECRPSRPWTAEVYVPDHFRDQVIAELAPYQGCVATRIGPFRTRNAAEAALERWWLRRLGVEA